MRYVMVGLSFTILSETPCAEPHAGCCGDWGLETPGYPIRHLFSPSYKQDDYFGYEAHQDTNSHPYNLL